MVTTLDPQIGYDWLFTTLKADATLTSLNGGRTFIEEAPPDTLYPFTLIQMLSGVPLVGLGGVLVQLNSLYMVKTITSGRAYTPIRATANRIVTVLNDSRGTTATGQVFSCVLDDVLLLPEHNDQSNQDWRNIIQRFRLALQ